jgi:hypothetical protein
VKQSQQQGDCQGSSRKRYDDPGDHQCLRHGIAAHASRSTTASDDAEQQEDTAAEED